MTGPFGTMKTRANEEGPTFPIEEANEMSPTASLCDAPEGGATGVNSGDDYVQILQDLAPLTSPTLVRNIPVGGEVSAFYRQLDTHHQIIENGMLIELGNLPSSLRPPDRQHCLQTQPSGQPSFIK